MCRHICNTVDLRCHVILSRQAAAAAAAAAAIEYQAPSSHGPLIKYQAPSSHGPLIKYQAPSSHGPLIKYQAPSSHGPLILAVGLRVVNTHPMQTKHCRSEDSAFIAAVMNAVAMLCLRLNHGCCPGISKLHMCRPANAVGCNRLSRYCSHCASFTGSDCGQQAASSQMRQ
jgi:hypothetical protein